MRPALSVFFLLLLAALAVKTRRPEAKAFDVVSQWLAVDGVRSDVVDDCVVVDSHVRDELLFVIVIGECKYKRRLLCFFDSWTNPTPARVHKSLESRVGHASSHGPLQEVAVLACDLPSSPPDFGELRLTLAGTPDTWVNNIRWRLPVLAPQRDTGVVVCSRLHALDDSWSPRETALLANWLEWHARQAVRVHLYVQALEPAAVWPVLEAYRERGVVVLHDWPPAQAKLERLWAGGRVAYTADCLLRYETQASFTAFYDVDEFVMARSTTTLARALERRFAAQPARPVVQLLHTSSVVAGGEPACDSECDSAPLVARLCDGAAANQTKWIVRNDAQRRVRLLPHIHRAVETDGTEPETIGADELRLLSTHAHAHHMPRAGSPAPASTSVSAAMGLSCSELAEMRDRESRFL